MRRILLILTLLAAVGCSTTEGVDTTSSGSNDPASDSAGFPVTVSAGNGEVTIEQRPGRIVSLAPTLTEVLFAIGAGDQVVAVDELSNYPEQAPRTELSGFEPNLEAVAALDPDLVVVSDDFNDIVSALTAVGISVIHNPAAAGLEDTYNQIEQLGAATGNPEAADGLVAAMSSEIDDLAASVQRRAVPLTYYHELDGSLFTVTSATFIGEVYGLAGLENIADAAEGADTLYPQLSAEFIIESDPDLIFLADTKCCGESAETVAARPGWDQLTAVTSGAVFALDDDIASRWGPRVVDLLETIVAATLEVGEGG
ncbi:MAG TPA: ABC transporter substrate-binding protein [Acidimicrobiia bacterium]|nr:ABC transporter substrate-binding protein [Acidimicrobiia bacterium]